MNILKAALPLAVIAIVAVTTLVVFSPDRAEDGPYRLRPDDSNLVATGAQIYQSHCAACHGSNLEGQPEWQSRDPNGLLPAPPHDASGHTWHHPDEMLFRITKFGIASVIGDPTYKAAMPVYEATLSDQDIVAVLSWIKAQWPAAIRERHDLVNAAAAKPSRP
jgi:mono/diheme cytochrome c family protein